MYNKKVLIILSIMCLPSLFCTCIDMMSFSLKLNNEKKYKLACNENQIEFQIKENMGSKYRILMTAKKGKFDFYPDSLTIIVPYKYEVYNMMCIYKKKEIYEHQTIEEGKTLICFFSMGGDFGAPIPDLSQIFIILPSGFIKCDERPFVTDSIRVSLK